jgi:hypothetical protein
MYVDHVLPLLDRHLLDHGRPRDSGIVDKAVHRAESLHRFLDRAAGEIGIDNAAGNRHDALVRQGFDCRP